MPGLLLIAHAPLASALKAVAEHTFPHCAVQLNVLDVTPDMSVEDVERSARSLLTSADHAEVLILTDVFGATPCNAAQRLQNAAVRVVSGVNVPMLWRSLCYVNEPLDALIVRAVQGGAAGIMLNELPVNPNSEA
ncbi:PTS sugar transporter subunit IIA [Roseateles oligotrophus]|uniref:PTS fructose transporter subunit IIA n=1 Tax=Roseateles oligotrophus TaxID=1769250 RepID=A0ABT2YDV4_9BURK|nr:PTS fructose transporter subunit IIA [Roseateles oligotrophus]MCV2368238.1 PTS fructose transporter subunit IIA [Roseateles oligotrophus]